MTPLLSARGLKVHFPVTRGTLFEREAGTIRAVDGVDLEIGRGETLGLVGESGCGKSTLGRALLQLLKPTAGTVFFDGREITALWKRTGLGGWAWSDELFALRARMQMVFQDPYASLDPRLTVEEIVSEPLRNFPEKAGGDPRGRVQELLSRVGMDPRCLRRYPHQFSGGQRQRIGIARALALSPELLVADEPISALDVSIQAQILFLLEGLQEEMSLSYLFISHDLSAVRHLADRIAVMYLGRIVETGPAGEVSREPRHPYTRALLAAVPIADPVRERGRRRSSLVGEPPSPFHPPTGCSFHPRCPDRMERCLREEPPLVALGEGRAASCHLLADPAPLRASR